MAICVHNATITTTVKHIYKLCTYIHIMFINTKTLIVKAYFALVFAFALYRNENSFCFISSPGVYERYNTNYEWAKTWMSDGPELASDKLQL